MRVSDIMSAPVYTIEANETAAAAWETMFFCRTRHLVVTDAEGRVVGVISASDLGGKTDGGALQQAAGEADRPGIHSLFLRLKRWTASRRAGALRLRTCFGKLKCQHHRRQRAEHEQ